MKKLVFICLLLIIFFPNTAYAQDISCDNRYVTFINPVRRREIWFDKTTKPLDDQYKLIEKNNFSGTWLLQYDILEDSELFTKIKNFNSNQEIGLFLEVTQKLSDQAKVIYPYDEPWFNPKVVFLSGYKLSERRRLIDAAFKNFNKKFGYYPKSVGAWWIDAYSLNYLHQKYKITSALIVADQLSTDGYGVWGQWWGVPYYPSKQNVLIPASEVKNKLPVVITQWAQRDLLLAYGDTPVYSNYSLQANDYIRQGKNTKYFIDLAKSYLDCKNSIGQITVGLETGIESVGYINEYANQLNEISKNVSVNSVTMSEFANTFSNIYPEVPGSVILQKDKSIWEMTKNYRKNDFLEDKITYSSNFIFADNYIADRNDFLDRKLPTQFNINNNFWFPWYLLIWLLIGIISYKSYFKYFIYGLIFLLFSSINIFRAFQTSNLSVYYTQPFANILSTQILTSLLVVPIMYFFKKFNIKIKSQYILLVFGFIFFIESLRYSYISGKYFIGIMTNDLHFLGFNWYKPFHINFVNYDLPSYQAIALIRIDFEKYVTSIWQLLIFQPFIILFCGVLLSLCLNYIPVKFRKFLLAVLILLTIMYAFDLLNTDPKNVTFQ